MSAPKTAGRCQFGTCRQPATRDAYWFKVGVWGRYCASCAVMLFNYGAVELVGNPSQSVQLRPCGCPSSSDESASGK